MTIRIGINGFGRIGKTVTRIMFERSGFEVVAINDLTDPERMAHGLKYDSVYRKFPGEVRAEGNCLHIGHQKVRLTAERDPAAIDWAAAGVDYVIESTGAFKKRADLEKHLAAGARKVILSVPPKEPLDATVVMGVNDSELTGKETLVSNASCTTNAAAPVTKIIHDNFGILRGYINTIHAYTNDQNLIDFPHNDWRRSRAAAMSVIPTTTGAAKAVTKVIPDLAGKLDGAAYRVPVPDGSIADMLFQVSRTVTAEEVNQVVKAAAEGAYAGIVRYETDPIVSTDIIGDPHSGIFDSGLTQVIDGCMVKVGSWYDNEWGYSARMVDLAEKLEKLEKAASA